MHATTWMILENIMLSERNQSQKATYCMVPFIRNVQDSKPIETEQIRGCLGLDAGVMTVHGYGVSFGSDEKCKINCGDGCTTLRIH